MKAILLLTLLTGFFSFSQTAVDADIDAVESKVIEWRRHFHQNPELSNREFLTARKIAEHLRDLGLEVQVGVGKTGISLPSIAD